MKTERNLDVGREEEFSNKIEQIHTVSEVEKFFTFADPILEVEWGVEEIPEEYTPAFIVEHPDRTAIFEIKNSSGEIIGGSKVKIVDNKARQRLGLDSGDIAKFKFALLEYTAIREEFRNKGLLTVLTDKRVEWARDHGVEYLCAECGMVDPVPLYTKLRDGFKVIGICEPGEGITVPYFVVIKNISEGNLLEPMDNSGTEWNEVEVNQESYDQLNQLFKEGWVGVDIKGVGENFENLDVPWTLILER